MTLPRVLFVTGKGGTGKSTVAAALAEALSHRRPTLLADLDRRLSAATLLGASPQGDAPVRVSDSLHVIALSQRAELNSFIRRIVPVAAISERMLRSRTFGYVTAALPGLEAFLLLDRLRIMAGDAALEDRYVVIDAPASGSALELLAVASGVKEIAPAGTLNRLANGVEAFLADRDRFAAIITTTPEELALREALDTARALRDQMGIAVAGAIVNRTVDALFEESELAALAGLRAHRQLAQKRTAQRIAALAACAELERAGMAAFELPMLFRAAMGVREVSALARALESGVLNR
ncbi:MAG TPA: ArsA-related P-loop ATPase [Candidatus Binataceae bacterium]|nr:ArsA-related P-loop ATPase [Candidatus Binataceae bacterium]